MAGRTQQGCCSSQDCPTNFADRAELGRRRLVLARRVSAAGSLILCAAAVVLVVAVPAGAQMADRLAWAAGIFGLPRLLGYARATLAARAVTVRQAAPLLVSAALVVIAAAGWPIVAALVVAAALTIDVVRRPVTAATPGPATTPPVTMPLTTGRPRSTAGRGPVPTDADQAQRV